MNEPTHSEQRDRSAPDHPNREGESAAGLVPLAGRGAIGGVLMGLANLVPGISGGTMLLAAGVYKDFIGAIASVTTLRFNPRSIVVLGSVVCAAFAAIVLLAGPVKDLVIDRRWIMYSLFIGLTLGGVPLVWNMLRKAGGVTPASVVGFCAGIAAMALLAFFKTGGGAGDAGFLMLLIAGIAGASAMILPGVSGGYLLLVLGVYTTILASIDRLKEAVRATDFEAALAEWSVVVPVGIGVVIGIAGLSNLIKWLLARRERPTLGVLLGLLVGSVLGLWPFQETAPVNPGDVIKGQTVIAIEATEGGDTVAVTQIDGVRNEIGREDWPLRVFSPSAAQALGSAALLALGLGITLGIARFGSTSEHEDEAPDARANKPH
jgi:putative membrane protein